MQESYILWARKKSKGKNKNYNYCIKSIYLKNIIWSTNKGIWFFQCRYATQVWNCMGQFVHFLDSTLMTWERSWLLYRQKVQESKRTWATRVMEVLWELWKQRNDCIFRQKRMPPCLLAKTHQRGNWICG